MFRATYQGLDPGTLTMAVFEKLLGSIGPANAARSQEWDDDMVRAVSLQKTNRKEIVELWYNSIFPPVRFDDG